jgi:hypothetical protein
LWRYHLHYFDLARVTLRDPGSAEHRRDPRASIDPGGKAALRCSSPSSVDLTSNQSCETTSPSRPRTCAPTSSSTPATNHLLKNLTGLVGLALFLTDERLLRFVIKHLLLQFEVQVLEDGGHFERSPGYHAQVLADLIDVSNLLQASGSMPGAVRQLEAAVVRMRSWWGALVLPDGSVPLLNDSVPVSEARLRALGVEPEPSEDPLMVLHASGYVIARPALARSRSWMLEHRVRTSSRRTPRPTRYRWSSTPTVIQSTSRLAPRRTCLAPADNTNDPL